MSNMLKICLTAQNANTFLFFFIKAGHILNEYLWCLDENKRFGHAHLHEIKLF